MQLTVKTGNSSTSSTKPWKGWGLGAFGLFAACAGCCLAPLIGTTLLAGGGASVAGWAFSWPLPAMLLVGVSIVLLYSVRKAKPASCCGSPGSGCGDAACGTSQSKGIGARP